MKLLIFVILTVVVSMTMPQAFAEDHQIPEWVKNNAKWWSEGKISEQEYLNSIEFLIDNKILKLETVYSAIKSHAFEEFDKSVTPHTEDKSARLQGSYLDSISVKFSNGDITEEIVLDTFARFSPGSDMSVLGNLKEFDSNSYFFLESLPSKDKSEFYQLLSMYINSGKIPQRFDVSITGLMNDGSKILTTNYKKCQAQEYTLYTQDLKIVFQYTRELQNEIRDRVLFYCGGWGVQNIGNDFP